MLKNVFVNQKTYDKVVKRLGYVPENLGVSIFVEDNEAIILDEKEKAK